MKTRSVLRRWRMAVLSVVAPITAMIAIPAHADVEGDVGLGVPTTSSVSAANPSLGVNRTTGAATAGYPFALPAARGGAQPSLALAYNSGASTREAGVGWGLMLPHITRRSATGSGPPGYGDIYPANNGALLDHFEFNGAALVPICLVGGAHAPQGDTECTNETFPTWPGVGQPNGWLYFRLQNEGAFGRFFWSPDFRTWRIQYKSGDVVELGVPLDATEDTSAVDIDTNALATPYPTTVPDGIYRWNIVRQFDAATMAGQAWNVVHYTWAKLGTHGLGYLADIYDTLPLGSDTKASLSSYANHTHLVWQAHDYPDVSHALMWRLVPDLRLAGVDVTSSPLSGGPRVLARRYHLTYDTLEDTQARLIPNHSFLTQLQMEGRCQSSPGIDQPIAEDRDGFLPPTTNCPTLPPTQLDYSAIQPNASWITLKQDQPFRAFRANGGATPSPVAIDINSDGLPDFVQGGDNCTGGFCTAQMDVFLNDGSQLTHTTATVQGDGTLGNPTRQTLLSTLTAMSVLGDFVSNGKMGIAWTEGGGPYGGGSTTYVPVLQQDQTWQWQNAIPSGGSFVVPGAPSYWPFLGGTLGDVDGDGFVDVINPVDAFGITQGGTYFTDRWVEAGGYRFVFGTWATPKGAKVFAVDMNGDGLADLASIVATNGTVAIAYIPGDGTGNFVAPPIMFPLPNHLLKAPTPLVAFLHDVNGDGYADLVALDDSPTTGPYRFVVTLNSAGASYADGLELPTASIPGWPAAKDFDPREAVYFFADMNGNGTDDFVVIPPGGPVSFFDMTTVPPAPDASTVATRPGLLVSMTSSDGAQTKLQYTDTIDLMRRDNFEGSNQWTTTSPQPAQLVTQIWTSSGVDPAHGGVQRTTQYDYSSPAYDGWNRSLLGFRYTTTTEVGDANSPGQMITTTSFFDDVCQDLTKVCNPVPQDGGETAAVFGANDPPYGPLRGAVVLSESSDFAGNAYHSTVHSQYQLVELYKGLDGRHVRYAYVGQTDTFLYDTATFAPVANETTSIPDVVAPAGYTAYPPRSVHLRSPNREHLQRAATMDNTGNLRQSIDYGRVEDLGTGLDNPIMSTTDFVLPPSDQTGWSYRPSVSTASNSWCASTTCYSREYDYFYDTAGRPIYTYGVLQGTLPLQRMHEVPGAGTAPPPTHASGDGTRITLAAYIYDPTSGNLSQVAGANGQCASVGYDRAFGRVATSQTVYANGCGVPAGAMTALTTHDPGIGAVTRRESISGAATAYSYDGFGRLIAAYAPDLQIPTVTSTLPALTIQYFDGDPVPRRVQTRALEGAANGGGTYVDLWKYVDGLGNTVATMKQADPAAGDGGKWILGGQVVRNAKGLVQTALRSSFTSSDPTAALPTTTGAVASGSTYDAFGRVIQSTGPDGAFTSLRAYHALSLDVYDASKLSSNGVKPIGLPVSVYGDGFGRTWRMTGHLRKGSTDDLTTTVSFLPTGEVSAVRQTHTGGSDAVTRTMTYDSMGRLVFNAEPNTSTPATASSPARAWTYAYDDSGRLVGTSDARGCGKNIFYDNFGRVLAEDYSPCRATQAPYDGFTLATGEASEVLNTYDAPDPSSPIPVTNPMFYVGRLASTFDRGAHTAYSYDGKGELVATARQIAAPGVPSWDLGSRYAAYWYQKSLAYDVAGRVMTESTGADVPELVAATTQSLVTYGYSQRGVVTSIGGSYGALLKNATFDADGKPTASLYGDVAGTNAAYSYNAKLWLQEYKLSRAAPSLWSAPPSASYPVPPPGATTPTVLADPSFQYDPVGNPTAIGDGRIAGEWPVGAKPVARVMNYDDFSRLLEIDYDYLGGSDTQVDPFEPEHSAGTTTSLPQPVPMRSLKTRVIKQTFNYDWLGNTASSDDDLHAFYDRSLGTIVNGGAVHPNQLQSAYVPCSGPGFCFPSQLLETTYDAAGNLENLIVGRTGECDGGNCVQRFAYEWDEVGQLARAQRWDGSGDAVFPAIPSGTAAADLSYAYSGGLRVRKSAADDAKNTRHTLEIFGSLRLNQAGWDGTTYQRDATTEAVYLGSIARLIWEPVAPSVSGGKLHVVLQFGDHLGSTSLSVDRDSSELVESSTYTAYGMADSDYRPARWGDQREDYRFTGKEEDVEVGVTYFGARYYHAALGRWMSADPLTIHGLGSDLNPYAYVSGRPTAHVDPLGLAEGDGESGGGEGGDDGGSVYNPYTTSYSSTGVAPPSPRSHGPYLCLTCDQFATSLGYAPEPWPGTAGPNMGPWFAPTPSFQSAPAPGGAIWRNPFTGEMKWNPYAKTAFEAFAVGTPYVRSESSLAGAILLALLKANYGAGSGLYDDLHDTFDSDLSAGKRIWSGVLAAAAIIPLTGDVRAGAEGLVTGMRAMAPIVEGAVSEIVEGGGLAAHELAGGHLLARHVGMDAAALDARLAGQGNLTVASSFASRAEAEAAGSAALRQNAALIAPWLQSGANSRLVVTGPFSGGTIRILGGLSGEATGATFVLQGNRAGGFFILTGFPVP